MMRYHQIKFGCKKISSSADIVETVIFDQMSPSCDPELEDSKPVFLHDTLAHNAASSYQVWLQKIQQLRRYPPDEYSLEFWTFSVTLTRTTTEQSNLFTRQSTLWWCTNKPSLVAKGSAFQIIDLKVKFWLYYPKLWPCPWRQQPNFLKDIMMHYHTKFGSKRLSDSENTICANIQWYFEILLWPWPWAQSNFSTKHSGLW